ncbi:MAG: SUMF1/EgtB/PvdO family nonheme iron enzyme [Prochloraceae cyanobacterium]
MDIEFVGGGRFQILKAIGAGSFGQTYLAKDLQQFDSLCTLKRLQPLASSPETFKIARDLFEKEAKVLYKLNHKHNCIPYLLAYFQEDKHFYLAQEFIAGHDLSRELKPGKPISAFEAVELLKHILEPLAFLHSNKVIHRDIKPSNLMRRSGDGKVVLIDFGAIKQLAVTEIQENGTTKIGTIIGTPGYMPSEQHRGKAKFSSDIYAVGIVAIQALTGLHVHNLPEDSNTGELIWEDRVSYLPHSLKSILEKMVRYHFKERYLDAKEALEAVEAIALDPSLKTPDSPGLEVEDLDSKQLENLFDTNLLYNSSSTIWLKGAGPQNIIETSDNSDILTTNFCEERVNVFKTTLKTFTFDSIVVDRTGKKIKKTNLTAEYLTLDLGDGIYLDTIPLSGGTFQMGAAAKEKGSDLREKPRHEITVSNFAIGKYLITQAQWRVVASKYARVNRDLNENPAHFQGDDRPVEKVSWYDAIEFCDRLSQKTGLVYRLPTEAEWEYAARAGSSTPFAFGETITSDLANYDANYTYARETAGKYRAETVDVGSFPPNAFGLYDMHGQVWEWCFDSWRENYLENSNNNNISPLRGGAWNYSPNYCRSACRYDIGEKNLISKFIGFRVVCEIGNS